MLFDRPKANAHTVGNSSNADRNAGSIFEASQTIGPKGHFY